MFTHQYVIHKTHIWKFFVDVATRPIIVRRRKVGLILAEKFKKSATSKNLIIALTPEEIARYGTSTNNIPNGFASDWQVNFQIPATARMEHMLELHHDIMWYVVLIVTFVLWVLICIVRLFSWSNKRTRRFSFQHHTIIEIVWTFIPSFILLLIAAPSFALLYSIDELHDAKVTLKIIGHQWYWSYEYTDFATQQQIQFDSYMVTEDDLLVGSLRLLEVDNRVILPVKVGIRLLITSSDVLHSWAVPCLGIKMDACPGRLNMVSLYLTKIGTFYGQCSELCGVNHAFMPICVESTDKGQIYYYW